MLGLCVDAVFQRELWSSESSDRWRSSMQTSRSRWGALSSGSCWCCCRLAAVIGREFDLRLLCASLGVEEVSLLDQVEAAMAASVLSESSEQIGRFRFAHTLAFRPDAAAGVDEVSWRGHPQDLETDVRSLHARVHRGPYRARPARRAYIPKPDGRQPPGAGAARPRGPGHRSRHRMASSCQTTIPPILLENTRSP
jgi:hypothetical protein